MTPVVALLALLCPAGQQAAACTTETAIISIPHTLHRGADCSALLGQAQFEAARLPPAGPGERWIFVCGAPR